MILLYRILTTFFYPIFVLIIFYRKLIKKEDQIRYKEKIFFKNFNIKRRKDSRLIWFHAASIGELRSILPIIKILNQTQNSLEFLITTTTLSSANLAKDELKKFDNMHHRFIPIDSPFLIKKFLYSWKPDTIFLVDSEIWPNLILEAKKNKISISIINARITKKTFKRWMLIPNTAKYIFSLFDLCLSSSEETSNFLNKLNAKNVKYLGNIKFITDIDRSIPKNNEEEAFEKYKFWLAASTHDSEELFCLKTHLLLKEKIKNLITIIAPRHINRVDKVEKLCNKFNLSSQIVKKNDPIAKNKEIIIINSYGNLPRFLSLSKSVFMGKSTIESLKSVGGQSPIEAAKFGCKIYHGPFVYNFKEIYEILNKIKVSYEIRNPDELAMRLSSDLKDDKNNNKEFLVLIKDLERKTLNETMNSINKFLFNENK